MEDYNVERPATTNVSFILSTLTKNNDVLSSSVPPQLIKNEQQQISNIQNSTFGNNNRTATTIAKAKQNKLVRMVRKVQRKKNIATKYFKVDQRKERERIYFLSRLKTVVSGQHTKVNGYYDELIQLQKSAFEELKAETKELEKDDKELFGGGSGEGGNGVTMTKKQKRKRIEDLSEKLKQKLDFQKQLNLEFDKRQRILANTLELVQTFIDKDIKQSEKHRTTLSTMNNQVFNFTNDLLRYVNHYIIEDNIGGSGGGGNRATNQDTYSKGVTSSSPLFRNYRINNIIGGGSGITIGSSNSNNNGGGNGNGGNLNSNAKEQMHVDLKKIISRRSKKKRYTSQKNLQ